MRSNRNSLQCYGAYLAATAAITLGSYTARAETPSPEDRSVRYFAIADPQYASYRCCTLQGEEVPPDEPCDVPHIYECPSNLARNEKADETAAEMVDRIIADSSIRGIIVAGDCTQNAGVTYEWPWYLNSWADHLDHVFDGLGNHDYGVFDWQIRNNIRNRERVTECNHGPEGNPPFNPQVPHYSWDWHDVHFVQLNLMPADEAAVDIHPDATSLDPGLALEFLQNDLAAHVGNSGRPVVLIHHYGFDCFSPAWWEQQQRDEYWYAIQDYNVALIITGHKHLGAGTDSWHWWAGPNHVLASCSTELKCCLDDAYIFDLDTIDTVDVAASHNHKYTEIRMGPHNMTTVSVIGTPEASDSGQNYIHHFLKGKAIYVGNFLAGQGDGSPQYPWKTLQAAGDAANLILSELAADEATCCFQEQGPANPQCNIDSDGDGWTDCEDLCPYVNGSNMDSDGDGTGNLCDNCPTNPCQSTRNWYGDGLTIRINAGDYPEPAIIDAPVTLIATNGTVRLGA